MTSGEGKRRGLLVLCLLAGLLFAALGLWQIERRAWKRDLIARLEARLAEPPVPVPGRAHWATFAPREAEYRRVRLRGVFLHDRETLVDALTERGPGSWVITPLATADGVILVNRGFVPAERRDLRSRLAARPNDEIAVTGLLRLSEPDGRIMRPNVPSADRWFSRDVAAIADARGLSQAAPFFVDAEAAGPLGTFPIGGMTVVHFRDWHLAYALTWFALAALAWFGAVITTRDTRKARRGKARRGKARRGKARGERKSSAH